jgi:hypothetical protein
MKFVKWILAALLLASAPFVLLAAVNFNDEPLTPEVKKVLDKPRPVPTADEKKAFEFVEQLYKQNGGKPIWNKPDAVDNYIQLIQFGAGMNIFTPTEEHPESPYVMLPLDTHRAFLDRLAGWFHNGGDARAFDLLEASNHYVASFFHHGKVMERSVALEEMLLNAQFLKGTLSAQPALHIPSSLIESFKAPDLNHFLFDALDEDIQSAFMLLGSAHWIAQIAPAGRYAIFLLRPHETLNHAFDIATQLLTSDCPTITAETADLCAPALDWLKRETGPRRWINPTGRAFVKDWLPQLSALRLRSADKIREIIQTKEELSRHI